jgi:hypothetical protein
MFRDYAEGEKKLRRYVCGAKLSARTPGALAGNKSISVSRRLAADQFESGFCS